ncbi:MAG TPA: RidA family protein [Clostridiaceae bacterium]|jgi:enamine deaminase RidA (YjgF/YER057c/UK114 family)|nr:RidA family protein [Clostridiaceae bacterium]
MNAEQRCEQLGIKLPEVSKPVASYVATVLSGNLLFVSGQLCTVAGEFKYKGKVGKEVSLDDACQAARASTINALATIKQEIGSLNKVKRVVKVVGFVASAPDFYDQPKVINGASDLLLEVFGEKGKHARSAVGVAALPFNVPVEVELIVEV